MVVHCILQYSFCFGDLAREPASRKKIACEESRTSGVVVDRLNKLVTAIN